LPTQTGLRTERVVRRDRGISRALRAVERIDRWIDALRRGNAEKRREAARALGMIGAAVRRSVPVLFAKLTDEDDKVYYAVVEALRQIGAEGIAALSRALKHGNRSVRDAAIWAVGKIGPEANATVAVLLEALNEEDFRINAAWALGRIGPDAREALVGQLRSRSADVRKHAAGVLLLMGPEGVSALEEALADDDPNLRRSVVVALGKIGPGARAAAAVIARTLEDEDEQVRKSVVVALGKIGPGAKAAIPALGKALATDDKRFRSSVARALKKIDK